MPDDKGRILVIEDDSATRAFLNEALSFEGYNVKTSANGRLGLRATFIFNPDLILLDMYMPTMSGAEFIAVYKRSSQSAPIIGLSARNLKRDYVRELGIAAFVEKPFSLDGLLDNIQALIKQE